MKKSNIYILLVLVALGGVAIYFKMTEKSGTLSVPLKNFSVSDTASVDKIIMADRNGVTATLERKSGKWFINGKYEAFRERVETLLMTMKLVEVKSPIGVKAKDFYLKQLSSGGLKVEIFSKSDMLKTYYVGGTTPDQLGTIMMIEGSSEPFITHIPGFNGYLSSRYFTEEIDWRIRSVYELNPMTIKSVQLDYPSRIKDAFRVEKEGSKFYLFSEVDNQRLIAPALGKEIIIGASNVQFDDFVDANKGINKDSIAKSVPHLIITVKLEDGKVLPSLNLYTKLGEQSTKYLDANGLDNELFYGAMSDNPKELFYVQRFAIKKLLHTLGDFR